MMKRCVGKKGVFSGVLGKRGGLLLTTGGKKKRTVRVDPFVQKRGGGLVQGGKGRGWGLLEKKGFSALVVGVGKGLKPLCGGEGVLGAGTAGGFLFLRFGGVKERRKEMSFCAWRGCAGAEGGGPARRRERGCFWWD